MSGLIQGRKRVLQPLEGRGDVGQNALAGDRQAQAGV
jgi:hypothetical protein